MTVFVVHNYDYGDNSTDLVGVYGEFHKAIAGADAYRAWHKTTSDGFFVTPAIIDRNHTKRCAFYNDFRLAKGCIPKYLLIGLPQELKERFG